MTDGIFPCPYTKFSLVSKKYIIQRLIHERTDFDSMNIILKEYMKDTYGEYTELSNDDYDDDYDDDDDSEDYDDDDDDAEEYQICNEEDIDSLMEDYSIRNIKELYVFANPIPSRVFWLTSLKALVIHSELNTELTTLPAEIGNLTKLMQLDISENKITTLPAEIGNLTKLERLNLDDNQLTTLPPEIGNLTQLERLEVSHNQLTTLPAEIGNLTKLEILYFHQNELTTLPPEIGNLTKLIWLSISHNQLTTLPPEIGNLTELKELRLDHTELTTLPPEIGNLTKLQILDVSRNELLAELPQEIIRMRTQGTKIYGSVVGAVAVAGQDGVPGQPPARRFRATR
jgi:hypothetical protein